MKACTCGSYTGRRILRRAAILIIPIAAVLSGAEPAPSRSALPEDVLVLARTKQKVGAQLAQLTNYVCLQTAERWGRKSSDTPFALMDTLRFEVAQIGNAEMYAWPGAESFREQTPAELAGSGFASSGSFGAHLSAAFLSGGTVTTFAGAGELNGRRALRYDYSVPSFLSVIALRVGRATGVASRKGSFWVDPQTFDVMRLRIEAEDIAANIPLAAVVTNIDYARVRIGARDLWLPQSADETMTETSGQQFQNRVEHSHCRVYAAESVLSFGEGASASGPPVAARIKEIRLPAGLTLPVQLETEVDSAKAAVGDLLAATITTDIVANSSLRISKGTTVHGRLRMVRREMEPVAHYIIGLEFSQIELGDKRAAFYARLQQPPVLPGLREYFTRTSRKSSQSGGGPVQAYTNETVTTEQYRVADLPGISVFIMNGTEFRLPKGLRMVWKTEETK
ncbi:MAG TPA: hypothetical protein VN428_18495 [Bryobacteraceae bacterium]|nr:hypothetical protein [Bryobacteraceae bacterium]